MGRLAGKAAIVTGGCTGLGLTFSSALLAEGAQVLAVDIADPGEAEAAGATVLTADITAPETGAQAVAAALDAFGRIDILVNNAALFAPLPAERYNVIPPDLFAQVLDVNIMGTWRMIRAVGPVLEAQGSGRIVNITSGTVMKGMPGMAHYIASKGAVHALTRALSREMGANGVCVNNLAPGLTLSTSILDNQAHLEAARDRVIASRAIQRDGFPEDLTAALIFLCTDEAGFITGQTIAVDGGSVNT